MTKTLDQLVKEAKDALEKAEAGSMEHAAATGRIEALTNLKQMGFGFTQDDLDKIDRQAKESYENSIKEVLGMTLDEAKGVIANFEESGAGEGEEEGEGNPLKQMQSTVEQQQQQIKNLKEANESTSRSLFSTQVKGNLQDAFRTLEVGDGDEKARVSLKDGRYDFVRGLAGEQELIEKLMKGETLPDDVYQQRAKSVYEGLPEVFETEGSEPNPGVGERTVLGHKIKDEGPGIPATPSSGQTAEITDEDRRQRAASVY